MAAATPVLAHFLFTGHSTEQIAVLRHRSPATARNQLSALYQKLGVARRTEAVAKHLDAEPAEVEIVTLAAVRDEDREKNGTFVLLLS